MVYILFVQPDVIHFIMFTGLSLSAAILFVGFSVFISSLSFYLGNAPALAEQWRSAMITFSTYPAILFDGVTKLILYTFIPAGFVSYLPVEALRQFSLGHAALALVGSFAIMLAGVLFFYRGLRRRSALPPRRW